MNRFLQLGGIAAFVFAAASGAHANPSVQYPQGNLSLMVKFQPKSENKSGREEENPASPTMILSQVRITRVNGLIRYQLEWSDGRKSEIWQTGESGAIVSQNVWNGDVFMARAESTPLPPLAWLDNRAIRWIAPANLVKEVSFLGKQCALHQKMMPRPAEDENSGRRQVLYKAWIDPESRLPVGFDDGEMLYTVAFDEEPPSGPLVMPENFQKVLKNWQELIKKPAHR